MHWERDFAQHWHLLGDRAACWRVARYCDFSRSDEAHYRRQHRAGADVAGSRPFENGVALEQFRARANQVLVVVAERADQRRFAHHIYMSDLGAQKRGVKWIHAEPERQDYTMPRWPFLKADVRLVIVVGEIELLACKVA